MANKKITQLASKTSVLSTDLFPIGDATTGTLYKKTIAELQAAIGGAVVSVQGKVGVIVLNTDDISEAVSPTNLYFTNTRARNAISLTSTGSSGSATYSASTGVINVPTYTLAGLGGINATFLSGGTGITYNSGTGVISYSGTVYTDTSVRGLFSAGTGLSYNSTTGVFTNTITQYTDALARAAISATSPITYNSTTGAIGITGSNLTESTSSVLTITGGTGALLSAASIQVKQASGSQSGFLSSTDWTTFNNKQSALSGGTAGYITFWTGSSSLGSDSAIFWDNTNKRLGIGTTSPVSKLYVAGTIGCTTSFTLDRNGSDSIYTAFYQQDTLSSTAYAINMQMGTSGGFQFHTFNGAWNERMRITSGGNVGIGTTSPSYLLTLGVSTGNAVTSTTSFAITTNGEYGVNAAKKFLNINFVGYSASIKAQIQSWDESGDTGNGTLTFNTTIGGTLGERFRIAVSSGNMLLGTTTDNGERLYVSGAIRATGTITANSDITLKKNLAKIENALEKVEQINGYTYEFKEDDSKRHAGVIAQEINEVLPEIVNKGNDGILGVEYGNISALLIEAIKEQQAQINELKALLNK